MFTQINIWLAQKTSLGSTTKYSRVVWSQCCYSLHSSDGLVLSTGKIFILLLAVVLRCA